MTRSIPGPTNYIENYVSPYLLRPLRSYDQVRAEIETRQRNAQVIMTLVPTICSTEAHTSPTPQIAA